MGDTPALDTALGIATLLSEHWDAIDADFVRFYRLDLESACFGPSHAGLRRLKALIGALPPESALARAMGWSWSDEREMTATLVELLHDQVTSSRALVSAFTGKRFNGPPKPLRWPRPTLNVSTTPKTSEPAPPLDRQSIRSILVR